MQEPEEKQIHRAHLNWQREDDFVLNNNQLISPIELYVYVLESVLSLTAQLNSFLFARNEREESLGL